MTKEEAIEILKYLIPIPYRGDGKSTTHLMQRNALTMAIKALEQEPKTGHWKIIPLNNYGEYRPNKYACSECGWEIDLCRGLQQDTGHRLFCEHCGAKMAESEEVK